MTKEDQHIEWKEVWKDEYLKWISAFANADGGVLEIGRNDAGVVVGLPDASKLLEVMPNKVRDVLGILVGVNLKSEAGNEYLEIVVDSYPNPVSYKGQYFIRTGSTTQEIKGTALDLFLLKKQGRRWDGVPVPNVSVADLDNQSLQRFRRLALKKQRLSPEILEEDNTHLIDKLHLTEGKYLKRAALLLFYPDPERFVTGAYVKIGFFESNIDLRYQDEVHGDLFTQVNQTIEILHAKYLKALISYEGIQRVETYPVPDAALRETLLNAVIHKDYGSNVPIQISVYPDKMMFWNNGELHTGWTIETLLQKHSSQPSNPDIANAFFRVGSIESWGRGIEKIIDACQNAGTPRPEFKYEGTGLWVVFNFAPNYINPTDQVSDQVSDQVTDQVHRLILVVGRDTLTSSRIREKLQIKHRPTFSENYLHPAQEQGFVEMTIPDKPNSRLQQYRLTKAGLALLGTLQKRGTP